MTSRVLLNEPSIPKHEIMKPLYSADQLQQMDQETQRLGLGESVLMEQAVTGMTLLVRKWLRQRRLRRVHVLVGPGNNGADGWGVARQLQCQGFEVSADPVLGPGTSEIWRSQESWAKLAGVEVLSTVEVPDRQNVVLIDAVFGLGQRLPLPASLKFVYSLAREFASRVALDVPTGLDATTGHVEGEQFIPADLTLSVGGLKAGFFCHRGTEVVGKILTVPMSHLGALPSPFAQVVQAPDLSTLLPMRRNWHNKSHGGSAVLLAGWDYPGAAILALRGAQAVGAGYVHWIPPIEKRSMVAQIVSQLPNVILQGESWRRESVLGIGSGIHADPTGIRFTEWVQAARRHGASLVLDAGALSAELASWRLTANDIITPHPAEAARILGATVEDVQRDRWAAARELVKVTGATVALKGHSPVVAVPGEAGLFVLPRGDHALAKAGMGDVLTGLITGLRAAGAGPRAACLLGFELLAAASDIFTSQGVGGGRKVASARSLSPNEVLELAPRALAQMESARS